jgi:hypothetical protein
MVRSASNGPRGEDDLDDKNARAVPWMEIIILNGTSTIALLIKLNWLRMEYSLLRRWLVMGISLIASMSRFRFVYLYLACWRERCHVGRQDSW